MTLGLAERRGTARAQSPQGRAGGGSGRPAGLRTRDPHGPQRCSAGVGSRRARSRCKHVRGVGPPRRTAMNLLFMGLKEGEARAETRASDGFPIPVRDDAGTASVLSDWSVTPLICSDWLEFVPFQSVRSLPFTSDCTRDIEGHKRDSALSPPLCTWPR